MLSLLLLCFLWHVDVYCLLQICRTACHIAIDDLNSMLLLTAWGTHQQSCILQSLSSIDSCKLLYHCCRSACLVAFRVMTAHLATRRAGPMQQQMLMPVSTPSEATFASVLKVKPDTSLIAVLPTKFKSAFDLTLSVLKNGSKQEANTDAATQSYTT